MSQQKKESNLHSLRNDVIQLHETTLACLTYFCLGSQGQGRQNFLDQIIQDGKLEVLEKLIEVHAIPIDQCIDKYNKTLLIKACEYNQPRIVDWLLRKGADVTIQAKLEQEDKDNQALINLHHDARGLRKIYLTKNALYCTIKAGSCPEIVNLLIQHGSPIILSTLAPLKEQKHKDQSSYSYQDKENGYFNALMLASYYGQANIIRALRQQPHQVAIHQLGITPIYYGLLRQHIDVIQYFYQEEATPINTILCSGMELDILTFLNSPAWVLDLMRVKLDETDRFTLFHFQTILCLLTQYNLDFTDLSFSNILTCGHKEENQACYDEIITHSFKMNKITLKTIIDCINHTDDSNIIKLIRKAIDNGYHTTVAANNSTLDRFEYKALIEFLDKLVTNNHWDIFCYLIKQVDINIIFSKDMFESTLTKYFSQTFNSGKKLVLLCTLLFNDKQLTETVLNAIDWNLHNIKNVELSDDLQVASLINAYFNNKKNNKNRHNQIEKLINAMELTDSKSRQKFLQALLQDIKNYEEYERVEIASRHKLIGFWTENNTFAADYKGVNLNINYNENENNKHLPNIIMNEIEMFSQFDLK